jgi:predicted enzyme related to lactoylglutathione lyase
MKPMVPARFFHLQLRTHDVEEARSFYAAVLGDGARDVARLPEQAVARGAPPHWLGHLEVEDVDDAVAAFVKRGAMALGPKRVDTNGLEAAVVREPGGAVVALAKAQEREPRGTEAVWYQLNTIDVDRAMDDYRTLFGWSFGAPLDRGELGVFHPFAWRRGDPPVGWMTDIFGRAGRHAHWLFHFRISAMEPALAAVRDGGGYVVGPFELGPGERLAVCDDSQSAAFAIRAP